MIHEALMRAMWWALVGNAVFMTAWLGYMIFAHAHFARILVDAALVVASVLLADLYDKELSRR